MPSEILNTRAADLSGPIQRFVEVTPGDDQRLPLGLTRGLYVGTGGTIVVEDWQGGVATFMSADCQYHPLRVTRVLSSRSTAQDIVALY